jgi:Protein of unknown function (DUF1588)/Protein of unknown function (DUF1592)/Protein of unknown function (DUF1585)/Planctomycete cytochrome C
MRFFLIATLLIHSVCSYAVGETVSAAKAPGYKFEIPPKVADLLDFNCYECHDSGTKKGGIQLDNLAELGQQARLDLLNNALEQVYSGEMPPKKADQPTEAERADLVDWMWEELKIFNASKLEDKLRYYKYANLISHEKLFNGGSKTASYTDSRRWRVNELIYHERINDVLELEGKARQPSFFGVVKPFNLPTDPGVAYYDTEIIEGGQFLTLLSNAKWVVDKQLREALIQNGTYEYPAEYLEVKKNDPRSLIKRFPGEAWNPGKTAEPFGALARSAGTPPDDLLENAITHQFKVTLQRAPGDAEMAKYLAFMKGTMAHSDTTSALKKMMVSVLMEPEFLYRNEFGGGEPDEHGRTKLTPREASYAIAYALTDRIPDKALVEAAQTGKLETRGDYEREVRRILADGMIDKPRILRFFQDYFGYKGIYNVFKDEERFGGAYNPHRVVAQKYIYRVPGKLSGEADTLVKWVLERDKDVLKTLLTTDRFFVDHSGNNAEMAEKAKKTTDEFAKNRLVYKTLKDLKNRDWGEALLKLDKQHPEMKVTEGFVTKEGKQSRHLGLTMRQARLYFGEDGTKDENSGKIYPPHDGEAVDHSAQMYNIDSRNWNYQADQPLKVENRIGMLTHPAWLTAMSHNAATDPVKRGKWVREKLLGGFIRDVPITVDAKVPEDPQSTLRERFRVTEDKKCWMCHEKMNPLGYTFESYDDFGRFRTEESIEYPENILNTKTVTAKDSNGIWKDFKMPVYKTKPVNPLGHLDGTGDKTLDGEIRDVPDLMNRLAKSDRVRQVFVRNVFRYFMGRNETLSDSPTLIEADRVYVKSGGSFRELMVSILTSDSFIHRK